MPVPTPPTGSFYGTRSTSNTVSWTVTGSTWVNATYTSTGSITSWLPPKAKVKNGKYQVRCRSCARWAKIIEEKGGYLTVNCERCLGKNQGFIP